MRLLTTPGTTVQVVADEHHFGGRMGEDQPGRRQHNGDWGGWIEFS
jgi:hypothetical protein